MTAADKTATDKKGLRQKARTIRKALHQGQPDFPSALAARADEVSARIEAAGFPAKSVIAGYAAIKSEANPALLMAALAARGYPLALPCVIAPDAPLIFRRFTPGTDLTDGAYGISEPAPETESIIPEVLLVPMLAFDASGHRLGYGGGYYDRTLAKLRRRGPTLAIGIAYRGQETENVAAGPLDMPLDMLFTEDGCRTFSSRTYE